MKGTYTEIEDKLARAYADELLHPSPLGDARCYPPPSEEGKSPARNVHCLWWAAMSLLTEGDKPRMPIDADPWNETSKYVDKQLATMNKTMSDMAREHLVYETAKYPQTLRNMSKKKSRIKKEKVC